MTEDEHYLYEGLNLLTKRRVNKDDFKRLYSEQLLEGICSKNYAYIREDEVIQITVVGVKHLLYLDTHVKPYRD